MKLTTDAATDTAILILDEAGFPTKTASTYSCGPDDGDNHVTLHFDATGVLLGAVIKKARETLPASIHLSARWDRASDGSSIYLTRAWHGASRKNHPCDPLQVRAMMVLDFDKDDRLISIEVLDASRFLPESVRSGAEIIG